MAQFKVGDRVKRIRDPRVDANLNRAIPLGAQGVVTEIDCDGDCDVRWDSDGYIRVAFRWTLAPLTPPAEDAWAADKVRQVTKLQPSFTTLRELLEVPR